MVLVGVVGGAGAIDAVSLVEAAGQAEAGLLIAAGDAGAAQPGVIAAIARAYEGLEAFAGTATGEDLHHAADGVGAVDRRARAA
ncbi:hypothetical protein D3C85_1746070 [compost metagenome]